MDASGQRKIVIIGAGIAGLSMGVYAQLNGYTSRIHEMHTQPGGFNDCMETKRIYHRWLHSLVDRFEQGIRLLPLLGRDWLDPGA